MEKFDGRSVEKCYLDDLAWSEMSGAGTFSHRAPHRISQWLISIIMASTSPVLGHSQSVDDDHTATTAKTTNSNNMRLIVDE